MEVMTLSEFLHRNTVVADIDTWGLAQKISDITKPLQQIGDFLNYILHPKLIFLLLWHWTVNMSYFICLFICIGAMLLYIFGNKKYAKWAPTSIGIYVLIQALGSAFK